MKRREFLKVTTATSFLAANPTASLLGAPKGFRYAICNESMKGMSWAEQCALAAEAGFNGIEIAPFTLVKEGVQEINKQQRKEMVKALRQNGLRCAGLHWLLVAPPIGLHCTTNDDAVRNRTWQYIEHLIDFCSDMEAEVMVFGSPKQRSARDAGISVAEAIKRLQDGLARVAPHAKKAGVKILLESLDHNQTDVINTLSQTLDVVKSVNHPAIQTMFDFHNTVDETEPFDVLIRTYYSYINHVHVQEMDGKYMGTGTGSKQYIKAFQTLKDLKYKKWISLEVFDFTPGAKTIAVQSLKTLKAIEAGLK
jgi:D-psicose/D-tagatose/L-ribulose 3-epimerase